MTDSPGLQADPSGLLPIGKVAALNIAAALELPKEHAAKIESAIKDEITAMSSHFTLAFSDIQTQYEVELAKIKSDFVWLKANKWFAGLVLSGVFVAGVVVGLLV